MSGGGATGGRFTADVSLVVQSWDAWLAEATGIPEGAACGRALVELFPDIESRGHLVRLRKVAEAGTVEVLAPAFHQYLIACAPRSPSLHYAHMQQHVTISPVLDGRTIIGLAVTIEDVTPRLDLERDIAIRLKSSDEGVRLHAVRTLAAMEPIGGVTGSLAEVLGDRSWRVRLAAADALASGSDASAVDALMTAVRDRHRDPAVLNAALTALARTEQDVVGGVIALLASPGVSAEVRTYAALALGLLEDRRAVPVLVGALADRDDNVRFHSIEALGRIGSREAAEPLAAVAESREFSVAFAALDALALIGEPSVAGRIVALLDDDLLQTAAAEALGRLGSEDVVAPLAALLNRPGAATIEIAGAIATLHARFEEWYGEGGLIADIARAVLRDEAVKNLIATLPVASESGLRSVALVLGWLRHEGVDQALAGLLHGPARRMVASILASRGTSSVVPLLGVLASGDAETRKAAASALGQVGSHSAVPALLELLDAEAEVAVVAAGALGSIGAAAACDALILHLGHPQAAVRQAVIGALNSIGHPGMPARMRVLLGDPSFRVRESAAKIAGYFGYSECAQQVMALCADEDEGVRRAAVEQLAHLDDAGAILLLGQALRTGAPTVRAAAARGLAHRPVHEAVPQLLEACADADPWVRFYAARSIGHLGDPSAAPLLLRLAIGDPVMPVRIAAIDALGEMGAVEAVATLRVLVRDADPAIARPALAALAQMRSDDAVEPIMDAVHSGDRDIAQAALAALGKRREAGAVASVAECARTGRDAGLRAAAVDALAQISTEASVEALIALADDPQRSALVVAALAGVGAQHVAWVGHGLQHADVDVRCAVVEALSRMRHPAASALLVGALEDAAGVVRLAAAQALGRLDVRFSEPAPGPATRVPSAS